MDTLKYWVWITQALGPANHRVWEVTRQYDCITEAYNGITSGNFKGMTEKEIKAFKTTHIEQAEALINYCEQKEIRVICYDDEINFPNRLREIYNPPTVLFCYGDLSYVDNSVALAVVGAREPSEYSIRVAENICTELSKVGTVIISGFAYGIDSIAHKSALSQNARTIAVLGSGIDYDYPRDNASIKKVLAKNGAVISEYFPGTKPFHEYFRQRNRLISALSLGVLIVQASSTSGSLNTASHALQQGKDIFCIPPHDVFDEKYSGVISLMRDGAIPVFSHLDVMYEYYDNFSHKLSNNKPFEEYFIKKSDITDNIKKQPKSTEFPKEKAHKDKNNSEKIIAHDYSQLNDIQRKIVELLADGTKHVDELAVCLETDVSEILIELTELELSGHVNSLAGKRYSL